MKDPYETQDKMSIEAANGEDIVEVLPADGGIVTAADNQTVDGLVLPDGSARSADQIERSRAFRTYLILPLIFLTSAMFGGLRFAAGDGAFVFVPPALICLIFAAVLFISFARGGLLEIDGWFSDGLSTTHNVANAAVLSSVYAATVQVFNSVLPEAGLPFWVVSFCFAWSLWNNLFTGFDGRRLLRSMVALFAFAFTAKYLILTGLTAPPAEGGWLRSIFENPTREAMTWLLDLPRYSAGTGYIQFFTLGLYFLGLYLLPRSTRTL